MNNINPVEGYQNLPPIGPSSGSRPQNGPSMTQAAGKSEDQVQISQAALFLSKIAQMPEIRAEKVEAVRQALAEGTYDIEGKLSVALEKFLDENLM